MSNSKLPSGFVAYPSKKGISEIIKNAVVKINSSKVVRLQTWEDCRVGGKVIISEICKHIDDSEIFCADLTTFNLNVMFELGYAIAKDKRIWLLLDTSLNNTKNQFEQLRTLMTVGYVDYHNSEHIISRFYKDAPYDDLDATIYRQVILQNLPSTLLRNIFYLKSLYENEASIRLSTILEANKIPVITNDPQETGVQSLSWYGEKVYSSEGVISHLVNPERVGAWLHNSRYALIAGMAYGMQRKLLMLAEGDFLAPVDYADILKQYTSASEAIRYLQDWLHIIDKVIKDEGVAKREYRKKVKLVTKLKEIQIGEYVAEAESENIIDDDYFIETAPYIESREGKNVLFVGRKGTGKTANFYRLSKELENNSKNFVCPIKPLSYELESIVEIFNEYSKRDEKGYVIETLWKYLLYTEIALAIKRNIESRRFTNIKSEEKDLLYLIEDPRYGMKEEFSIRLERCINSLKMIRDGRKVDEGVEEYRTKIAEGLHQGILHDLRGLISKIVSDKQKIFILVDNLDRPWTKDADLNFLSHFIWGLVSILPRIIKEFNRHSSLHEKIEISLVVFLRSDIFYKLLSNAREPDKIKFTKLVWRDPEMLLRIIEERFSSLHDFVDPEIFWDKYICKDVRGIPVKEYIIQRILPRPRDIVYFVKAAISIAKNRSHVKVEQQDIIDAEKQYSQYALESIIVESTSFPEIEDVLYEFIGSPTIIQKEDIIKIISKCPNIKYSNDDVIENLISLGFLGVEVAQDEFRFVEEPEDKRKHMILSNNYFERSGGPQKYKINVPFWAYLELEEINS